MVQDREFVDKLVVVGNTECECECASGGTAVVPIWTMML